MFKFSLSLMSVLPGVAAYNLQPRDSYTINWAPCDPDIVIGSRVPIDCAYFPIPLDYHDASAGSGALFVAKVNATGERKGTLFVNPGGPGEPGVDYLAFAGMDLMNTTGGNYDIISWDPRGVGLQSTPGIVECFEHFADYIAFINGTLEGDGIDWTANFTDPAQIATLMSQATAMEDLYQQLGERCANAPNGSIPKYVGTAATARDLAAMGEAINGEGSLVNYWGFSYGTLLGAWFVNMFPDRVGHVILDGVVDIPAMAEVQSYALWEGRLRDSEKVYQGLANACALAGPSQCNITSAHWTGLDVKEYLEKVIEAAVEAASEHGAGLRLSSGTFREFLFSFLYSPLNWADDVEAIASAYIPEIASESNMNLNLSAIMPRRRSPLKRQSNDTGFDGVVFTEEAIFCSDSVDAVNTTMADIFQFLVNVTQTISPTFGALWPNDGFKCPWWPFRAVERYTGPFNKTLTNPILIMGNTADPITPFFHAKELADIMGENAALVQQDGFGHTSTAENSQCVKSIIQDYLNDGKLPSDKHTLCEIDATEELFPGVTTREVIASLQ